MKIHSYAPGEHYHLYSRGVEKRTIFLDKKDHERFIKLLFYCNGTKPVDIRNYKGLTFAENVDKKGERLVSLGAYCLMPNHFHLLLKQYKDGGISVFMQKLLTAYTMYFNAKYKRTGRLFESSFKSTHANYDEYLKYLFAYIHLNPLKLISSDWIKKKMFKEKKTLSSLWGYDYSSFQEYAGAVRDESHLLNKEEFPKYFENSADFIKNLSSWISTEVKPL